MAEPKDVDEALFMLQADPPVLVKDKKGQVGNQKTKYADLIQANEVILPRLTALGLLWVTAPTLRMIAGPNGQEDPRFVLDWEMKHVPSGTKREGIFPLPAGANPMQNGSAITYARRYALQAITNTVSEDEDDDGGAASGQRYAQRAAQRPRQQRPTGEPADGGRTVQRAAQRPRGNRPALPGEDVSPDPDGPVGAEQHRAMRALWAELGVGGDDRRDFRLRKMAEWLDLPELDSSASLTRAQGDVVIAKLRERKEQQAAQAPAEGGEG